MEKRSRVTAPIELACLRKGVRIYIFYKLDLSMNARRKSGAAIFLIYTILLVITRRLIASVFYLDRSKKMIDLQ